MCAWFGRSLSLSECQEGQEDIFCFGVDLYHFDGGTVAGLVLAKTQLIFKVIPKERKKTSRLVTKKPRIVTS